MILWFILFYSYCSIFPFLSANKKPGHWRLSSSIDKIHYRFLQLSVLLLGFQSPFTESIDCSAHGHAQNLRCILLLANTGLLPVQMQVSQSHWIRDRTANTFHKLNTPLISLKRNLIERVCVQIYFKLCEKQSVHKVEIQGRSRDFRIPKFSSERGIWAVERDRHKHIKQARPVPVGHWGTQHARPLEGFPPYCLRHFTDNLQKHKLKARISCQKSSRWDKHEIRWDDPLFVFNLNTYKAMNNYFRGTPSSTTSTKNLRHQRLSNLPKIKEQVLRGWRREYFASADYLTGINLKELSPPLLTIYEVL